MVLLLRCSLSHLSHAHELRVSNLFSVQIEWWLDELFNRNRLVLPVALRFIEFDFVQETGWKWSTIEWLYAGMPPRVVVPVLSVNITTSPSRCRPHPSWPPWWPHQLLPTSTRISDSPNNISSSSDEDEQRRRNNKNIALPAPFFPCTPPHDIYPFYYKKNIYTQTLLLLLLLLIIM